MKSNNSVEEIKDKFASLRLSKTEEDLTEEEAFILMAGFLSEIERISKSKGLNRKELALKINTSPSYLTQVFRGDKPLNFLTLAKIKRALNIQFEVKAFFQDERKSLYCGDHVYSPALAREEKL
jgi:ribosome-binding protein aMBF1 (putative translation factor)